MPLTATFSGSNIIELRRPRGGHESNAEQSLSDRLRHLPLLPPPYITEAMTEISLEIQQQWWEVIKHKYFTTPTRNVSLSVNSNKISANHVSRKKWKHWFRTNNGCDKTPSAAHVMSFDCRFNPVCAQLPSFMRNVSSQTVCWCFLLCDVLL